MKNLTIFSLAILLCTGMQAQNNNGERSYRITHERGQGLTITPEYTLTHEMKMTRNVSPQPGYIVRKNGVKIEGTVRIIFFDPNPIPGVINTDLRTAVSVGYTVVNSKGRERRKGHTFRPKKVQYFVVFDESGAEIRYEPVHRNVFGNLLSSTNVDLDAARKPYFQMVIYRKGDYTAYFDPSSEHESTNYSIAKKGEKANLFAELLRNGRVTRSVVGDCVVLLDKLERKELTNCIDGIETFINLLIECER